MPGRNEEDIIRWTVRPPVRMEISLLQVLSVKGNTGGDEDGNAQYRVN